ncbi:hypothetical protein BDF20DRAFT_909446 [Mycotypha africana]|uniref:uncharacterized protein n=1 Tax=Mycotypha africana TaxID=64632 RepID=UPI002301615C|nr:uncharacterized protein BDF20DRAFT_909446 [Mycotypha africana]KAI8991702.1 hypothetical protein BDF20DRAFT_909446 [Mycotypha africana]
MSTSKETDRGTKVIKGEKSKSSQFTQRNTLASLLNRAIKFRKSRYVDHKLEAFKQKFAPVNGTTGIVHASSSFSAYGNDGGGEDYLGEKIDANGFERPSKVLFNKKKLNTAWKEIYPVGSGLKDLGNLSALNAVLQALTYTPALANYLMDRTHSSNCTMQDYCFVCALEDHVRAVLKGSPYAIQPRSFAGKLKKLSKGSPKDAFNVYRFFVEQIQEFLLSEMTSKEKRVKETTALYQLFGGYLQKKLDCPACNQLENNYDALLDLSLSINRGNSVEQCLTHYFKQFISVSDKECIHCGHKGSFKGKRSIYRSPMNLVIHLQRFANDTDVTKNNKYIRFEETLDISRVITETEKEHTNSKYHLYAVITHTGETFHGGHYIAYVKSSNGIWHCMDNEVVQVVSLKKLLEQKPYMLFYHMPSEASSKKSKIPVKTENNNTPDEKLKSLATKDNTSDFEEEIAPINTQDNVEQPSEMYNATIIADDDTDEEEMEEKDRLRQAMETSSRKQKVENLNAIVVDQRADMKTKREKLNELIEKENELSKSAQVKEALLAKASNIQFQDDVDTWGEDIGSSVEKRDEVLKKLKGKRKKVDTYNLEYDRGKVKKVKKKRDEKFNQPNLFQMAADMKAQQQPKQKHKKK